MDGPDLVVEWCRVKVEENDKNKISLLLRKGEKEHK